MGGEKKRWSLGKGKQYDLAEEHELNLEEKSSTVEEEQREEALASINPTKEKVLLLSITTIVTVCLRPSPQPD